MWISIVRLLNGIQLISLVSRSNWIEKKWKYFQFYLFQTILFTTDEDILERVSQHDDSYNSVMNEGSSEPVFGKQLERPLTASIGVSIQSLSAARSLGQVSVIP